MWSPAELPKCLLGQHPRIRWSRRRRSTLRHIKNLISAHVMNHLSNSIQIVPRIKRSQDPLEASHNETAVSDTADNSKHEEKRPKQKLPCTVSNQSENY